MLHLSGIRLRGGGPSALGPAGIALAVAFAAGSAGALGISAIVLEQGSEVGAGTERWYFDAGIGGADIDPTTVASVVLHSDLSGRDLTLVDIGASQFAATEFFPSEAALLARFPTGSYTLSITLSSGAVVSDSVSYAPSFAPTGAAEILTPDVGETNAAVDPTFELVNGCTSCSFYNQGFRFDPTPVSVALFDRDAGDTLLAHQSLPRERTSFGPADLGVALEESTTYALRTAVFSSEYGPIVFDGATTNFWAYSTQIRSREFTTTPEPAALLLVTQGLVALALLSRLRRR